MVLFQEIYDQARNIFKLHNTVSSSEVVRDSLRLLKERDSLNKERLKALRSDIAVGLDQIKSGQLVDGEQAFADISRQLKRIKSRQK